jgi:hypothetical protein
MDWVESLDSPKPYMEKKQPPEKSYGAEQALSGDKARVPVCVPHPRGSITRALGYIVLGPRPIEGPMGGGCGIVTHITENPLL